ncbi:MAG: carboxymuconolactone decarboxylase family protein [Chitinophagaceae bacterium]|nr:carboxymuconolactone decarboxylase family protein [Chitinophagaceae bacterium]
MAHIELRNNLPGIRGLMAYRPDTAKHLNALAEALLHNDNNSLSKGERELIGAYVSYLNNCFFCQNVHGAMAQYYLNCNMEDIDAIKIDFTTSENISPKMKSLLAIAEAVQIGGSYVTPELIFNACSEGATDEEIHDTVLIASAFCMFNRYVDGLNTWAPQDRQGYINRAPQRAKDGYAEANIYQ